MPNGEEKAPVEQTTVSAIPESALPAGGQRIINQEKAGKLWAILALQPDIEVPSTSDEFAQVLQSPQQLASIHQYMLNKNPNFGTIEELQAKLFQPAHIPPPPLAEFVAPPTPAISEREVKLKAEKTPADFPVSTGQQTLFPVVPEEDISALTTSEKSTIGKLAEENRLKRQLATAERKGLMFDPVTNEFISPETSNADTETIVNQSLGHLGALSYEAIITGETSDQIRLQAETIERKEKDILAAKERYGNGKTAAVSFMNNNLDATRNLLWASEDEREDYRSRMIDAGTPSLLADNIINILDKRLMNNEVKKGISQKEKRIEQLNPDFSKTEISRQFARDIATDIASTMSQEEHRLININHEIRELSRGRSRQELTQQEFNDIVRLERERKELTRLKPMFNLLTGERIEKPTQEDIQNEVMIQGEANKVLAHQKNILPKLLIDTWTENKKIKEEYAAISADPEAHPLIEPVALGGRMGDPDKISKRERFQQMLIQSNRQLKIYQQAYLLNEDIFSVEKDIAFLKERGGEVLMENIIPEPIINTMREHNLLKDSDRAMMDFAYQSFSGTIGLSDKQIKQWERSTIESVTEGASAIGGIIFNMGLLNKATGIAGIQKVFQAIRTSKKLGKYGKITADLITRMGVEEAKGQIIGFEMGDMSAFVLAGRLVPVFRLKGALGEATTPLINRMAQSAMGAIGGIELANLFSSTVEAWKGDKDLDHALDEAGFAKYDKDKIIQSLVLFTTGLLHSRLPDIGADTQGMKLVAEQLKKDGFRQEANMMETQVLQIEAIRRWHKARKDKRVRETAARILGDEAAPKEEAKKFEDEAFVAVEAAKKGFTSEQIDAATPETLNRIVDENINPKNTRIVNDNLEVIGEPTAREIRVEATPAAAELIKLHNLNVEDVKGTGVGGRIKVGDISGLVKEAEARKERGEEPPIEKPVAKEAPAAEVKAEKGEIVPEELPFPFPSEVATAKKPEVLTVQEREAVKKEFEGVEPAEIIKEINKLDEAVYPERLAAMRELLPAEKAAAKPAPVSKEAKAKPEAAPPVSPAEEPAARPEPRISIDLTSKGVQPKKGETRKEDIAAEIKGKSVEDILKTKKTRLVKLKDLREDVKEHEPLEGTTKEEYAAIMVKEIDKGKTIAEAKAIAIREEKRAVEEDKLLARTAELEGKPVVRPAEPKPEVKEEKPAAKPKITSPELLKRASEIENIKADIEALIKNGATEKNKELIAARKQLGSAQRLKDKVEELEIEKQTKELSEEERLAASRQRAKELAAEAEAKRKTLEKQIEEELAKEKEQEKKKEEKPIEPTVITPEIRISINDIADKAKLETADKNAVSKLLELAEKRAGAEEPVVTFRGRTWTFKELLNNTFPKTAKETTGTRKELRNKLAKAGAEAKKQFDKKIEEIAMREWNEARQELDDTAELAAIIVGPATIKRIKANIKAYKALVNLAGIYISKGVRTAAEFAKAIGERLTAAIKQAWNQAFRIKKGDKGKTSKVNDRHMEDFETEQVNQVIIESIKAANGSLSGLKQELNIRAFAYEWVAKHNKSYREQGNKIAGNIRHKLDSLDTANSYENALNKLAGKAIKPEAPGKLPEMPVPETKKQRRAAKQILKSRILSDEIKQGLSADGIFYVPRAMKISQQEARSIIDFHIDKFGDEISGRESVGKMVMDKANQLAPSVRVELAKSLIHDYNMIAEKFGKDGKADLATATYNRAVDVANFIVEYGTGLGQGIKAFHGLANLTAEGTIIRINRQLKEINKPGLSEKEKIRFRRLHKKIINSPEGFPRYRAIEDLLREELRLQGISAWDVATSVWYANILSGYSTQQLNFLANMAETAGNFVTASIYNPKSVHWLLKGLYEGYGQGFWEALAVLKTGYSPINQVKFDLKHPEILEAWKPKHKIWLPLKAWVVVRRVMASADTFSFHGLKEMRAYEMAVREARRRKKQETPDVKIYKEVGEILLKTKERREAARTQAEAEGFKGLDFRRRVTELMELSRPGEIIESSNDIGSRGTFNYPSEGTLGMITSMVGNGTEKIATKTGLKPLKFVIPFTRIISNVANNYLDWTVWGYKRALTGTKIVKGGPLGLSVKIGTGGIGTFTGKGKSTFSREFTKEEQAKELIKATLGTTAAMAMFYMSDPEDGIFEVTADGTGDIQNNFQLQKEGWQPYSIRIGDKWYSYKNTPLGIMLATVGHIRDAEKYKGKSLENKDMFQRTQIVVYNTFKYASDMTFLSSFAGFMGSFSKENPTRAVNYFTRLGTQVTKGFFVPNIVTQVSRQIQSVYNMPMKQANTLWENIIRDIPIARNRLNDLVNVLGEPVVADTDRYISEKEFDPVWDLIIRNQSWIGKPPQNQRSLWIYDEATKGERPMDNDEYYQFIKLRGQKIREEIEDRFDELNALDVAGVHEEMSTIQGNATKEAKMELNFLTLKQATTPSSGRTRGRIRGRTSGRASGRNLR